MPRILKYCLYFYLGLAVSATTVRSDDIEINNKCTYSTNQRVLNCVGLEIAYSNIGEFITPKTLMLFLRNSENVNFGKNHHSNPNYSNLISYQILNSKHYSVTSAAFSGLSNVQYMKFHGNIWEEIEDDTFKGLNNLEVLNLSNNQISKLSRNSFNHLAKLITLNLSNNFLKTIPSNVFESLCQLESLYINNNLVNIIQENAFLGLSSLNFLYLTNNSMEYIDANEVNKLEKLRHFNVDFNKIRVINGQFKLDDLKFLQFSNNELSELPTDVFKNCPQLMSIDLSKNKLGLLTEKPFLNLDELKHLNLKGNAVNTAKFSNVKKIATIIYN